MTVYVDPIVNYGRKGSWCHMATDNLDDQTELHELAAKIGLRRDWYQPSKAHPHYDLTPIKRSWAVRLGAVEVTAVELAKRCSRLLRELATP